MQLPRRYQLTKLSPAAYLFVRVERWPFHSEPHGSLEPTFVSARTRQSPAVKPTLASLYALRDVRTALSGPSYSSVSSLGGRPPQLQTTPPCTVPIPDYEIRLEPQAYQGGISRSAPLELAPKLQSLPPILHRNAQSPVQSYSKGARGLSVLPRVHRIFTAISTSPSLGGDSVADIVRRPFVQVGTYPTRNSAHLNADITPFTGVGSRASPGRHMSLCFPA